MSIERDKPFTINGVEVEAQGEPLEVKGERWQTMVPIDEQDERLWEFSLDSGRIIRTK